MKDEKKRFRKGLQAVLRSKAKHTPKKQSVKFKCHIWFEATKKFAKKCLDASSRA